MNHNQLLGVNTNASNGEIQRAFRKAAKEIHPDHSSAPEAAEAFARIKEARDALIADAERASKVNSAEAVHAASAAAARAAGAAAYASQTVQANDASAYGTTDDPMTVEELHHVQELDQLAVKYAQTPFYKRQRESAEARAHRRKIQTTNKRIDGRY